MGLKYLNGKNWSDITREERVFCGELYLHARTDPKAFVEFLQREVNLTPPLDASAAWEIGYEVCFFRDYLHETGKQKKGAGYSLKRTYDLALFSEDEIVIIEAKSHEKFCTEQSSDFAKDRGEIGRLLGSSIRVRLIALASSKYFANYDRFGRSEVLKPFDGRLSWAAAAAQYGDSAVLLRAEGLYGGKTR